MLFGTICLFFLVGECSADIPNVTFNNGVRIPILGLGTLGSRSTKLIEAIKHAIDIGYRHFDCAYVYGNEKEIGQAISDKIREGVVKREDLFIVSKLWNSFHNPKDVEGALNTTLNDLRLTYVDLYLIHFPIGLKEDGEHFSDDDYVDTWKGMEGVYKKGLTRAIGISNFNKKQIERVLKYGSVVPVTNQVECHPLLNQQKLYDFCKSHNITLTSWSPLGGSGLSQNKQWLLDNPTIKLISTKLQKTPAQVLIRYQIQRGIIVIPRSANKDRIVENFQVFDFQISAGDMVTIDGLNINHRNGRIPEWEHHKYYPFLDEY